MPGSVETWISIPPHRRPKSWRNLDIDDPVVPLRLNLYGHPKAGLYWEQHCAKNILQNGFEKMRGWDNVFQHRQKKLWLSVYVDDFKLVGAKENIAPMWEALKKSIDLEPPIPLQNNVYLGCKQEPEAPDADAVQQKAFIFNGFFMNKHAQDMADAERRAPKGDAPASKSSDIASRKGMQSHSDEKDSI